MFFQRNFKQAGLVACLYADNRQRLHGSLVYPPGRDLRTTRYADLATRRVREVDHVWNHAKLFAPLWLAAGTQMKVTFLRADDTGVTARQLSETREAMALIKTLLRFTPAVDTKYVAAVLYLQRLPEQWIEGNLCVTDRQKIIDGIC